MLLLAVDKKHALGMPETGTKTALYIAASEGSRYLLVLAFEDWGIWWEAAAALREWTEVFTVRRCCRWH